MKLEVGMYVRTNNGLIGKIIGFKGDMIETDNKRLITYKSYHSECKIKEKLIDLIEEGDYINEKKVICVDYLTNGPREGTKAIDYYIAPNTLNYFTNEDIKSIVTKEQFEQMAYKVGE